MRSLKLLSARLIPTNSSTVLLTLDPSSNNQIYSISEVLDSGLSTYSIHRASITGNELVEEWTIEAGEIRLDNGTSVVSFQYLSESDSICVILSNGDIESIFQPATVNRSGIQRENVGSVEFGIQVAAWSPDDELLVLITGDDKLIEMTKDFEVLSEGSLRLAEFGEDAPVNVGWGEKSTQFHGSVGKSAASSSALPSSSTSSTIAIPTHLKSSPLDSTLPTISWRGDGAFFCVSSLDPLPTQELRRNLRIFSRVATLSSTSEMVIGLESPLSWQPTGSIIAATQILIDSNKPDDAPIQHVIFFEKNGLRRYDFALREDLSIGLDGIRKISRVKSLRWNSDSTLLSVWIQRISKGKSIDVVQLWHRNNYYWYLKQEIDQSLVDGSINSVFWDPENAMSMFVATSRGVESFEFSWDVFASLRAPPFDDGSVAVIDGSSTKLTPFRHANIPPPMSSTLAISTSTFSTPVHVHFVLNSTIFLSLTANGQIEIWNWELPDLSLPPRSRSEVLAPILTNTITLDKSSGGNAYAKQIAGIFSVEFGLIIAVLLDLPTGGSRLVLIRADGNQERIEMMDDARVLAVGEEKFILETSDGSILEVSSDVDADPFALPSSDLMPLPEFCPTISYLALTQYTNAVIGLSSSGRLYSSSTLLASDATSFISTPDFLIYTTFAHQVKFLLLSTLLTSPATHFSDTFGGKEKLGGIQRAVERGSRIVTVVPGSTALVLQMPRGNLEVIFPRPLVLQIVRQDLDSLKFRAAFLACRRHRIDLNILFDHNPQQFQDNLVGFVTQVKDIDYLNLFLSGLKEENVTITMYKPLVATNTISIPPNQKVDLICNLIRKELESRDVFHYANTILTAHVRKSTPDYESALKVLVQLKAKDAGRAEEAIKYIIFLSDANKLFDLALGMYDFALVLMIAQHSQKDPKEYLPFLRELRKLPDFEQKFAIDNHLERYESALENLAFAGKENFERVVEYTILHGKFVTALRIYKNDPVSHKIILNANAEYLMTKRDYAEAGLLFNLAGRIPKAMECYQLANQWEELFTLALDSKRSAADIKEMAIEVAESLKGKRRFSEAGKVLLEYGRDVEAAVRAFVEGNHFSEAIRLSSLYNRRDLIETHVKVGTLEMQSRLLDDFTELTYQVEKQVERLIELKVKRDSNPDQYFGIQDESVFGNVEMQPDGASDAGTAFTRYTAQATTVGGATTRSSQTSRSKRRAGMKKLAGKKGSIYEESYLLASFKRSIEIRLAELQVEVAVLLPILLFLNSTPQKTAASGLQTAFSELLTVLHDATSSIWDWREIEWKQEARDELDSRERGTWIEKPKPEDGTERVERPTWGKGKWRVGLLDSL